MTLLRIKHTFKYFDKKFYCFDVSWEDYVLFLIDPKQAYKKIILECNKELPLLNKRQYENFIAYVFGGEEKKEDLLKELTNKSKKENNKTETDLNEILDNIRIIEGQLMANLNQPLSELRKWPFMYLLEQQKNLPVILGHEKYDKKRKSQTPDKETFKKEFGNLYK